MLRLSITLRTYSRTKALLSSCFIKLDYPLVAKDFTQQLDSLTYYQYNDKHNYLRVSTSTYLRIRSRCLSIKRSQVKLMFA